MYKKIIFFLFSFFVFYSNAFSAELVSDKQELLKATVVDVLREESSDPLSSLAEKTQDLRVRIISGEQEGKEIEILNDYLPLEEKDVFYLLHTIRGDDGKEFWSVADVIRTPTLIVFGIIFVSVVVLFGGIQGVRGLLSLLGSFLVIAYILLPGILDGYSPLLLSIFSASLIIVVGSYITHGFNRTTSSAVIGMIITILMVGFVASIGVSSANLSGFDSEEAVFLNLNTGGKIDFGGLLLGGMLIGLLGVLYDAAIGQAVAVEELFRASPDMKPIRVFKRALRIGREHIGALVNTLAIAYVGVSLPLLLLFYGSTFLPFEAIVNKEIFATEIMRTLIGSIGLVLAVPITTIISVYMLRYHVKVDSVSSHNHS